MLFVGSCSGSFYCLRRDDGHVVWSVDTRPDEGGSQFHGDIHLDGELAIVGTDSQQEGALWAFDRDTGDVRWRLPAGRGVATAVIERDGFLWVGTLEEELFCLDRETGEIAWSFQAGPDESGGPDLGLMTPAVAGEVVFWAPLSATLLAFDAWTGEILWERFLSAPITTNPLILADDLLVGTEDGLVHRLSRATGETAAIHLVPAAPNGDLVPADSLLVLFVDWMQPFGEILALDPDDGTIRWSHPPPDTSKWTTKRPFILDDRVLAGNERGEVFAFDLADGSASALFDLDSMVRTFTVADRVLYVGTLDGSLRAYQLPR